MKILLLSLMLCGIAHGYYGEDNLQDGHEVRDPKIQELAKAVAYQIYFDELKGWTFNRYWEILITPLKDRSVCADERFAEQQSMRNDCSGILIGPKQLLLTGNCITDHYCKNGLFYFMFQHRLDSPGPMNVKRDSHNFYKCEKLLKRVYDPNTATSYAVIELNKVVQGVKPVTISKDSNINPNDELIAIGHPAGLPQKVAGDAWVTDQNSTHFLVNSDITGESKGTALFNARTYELEGMLIWGTENFVRTEEGCRRAPHLPKESTQELAIKASVLKF